MKLGKDDLLAALRLRYDHYSAQTIFDATRKQAGLADQPSYAGPEVAALRSALATVGDRLELVDERLDSLLEPKPAAIATRIVLSGVQVADGEKILVCGELAELGNWDPDRARPMTRDGEQWSATLELVPGTKGAFKFLRRAPDGSIQWEAGEDRGLQAVPRIDATWQS